MPQWATNGATSLFDRIRSQQSTIPATVIATTTPATSATTGPFACRG